MVESFDRFQRICYLVIAFLGVPGKLVEVYQLKVMVEIFWFWFHSVNFSYVHVRSGGVEIIR